MGVTAGAVTVAAKMPGERIGTRVLVADTGAATGTTEEEAITITVSLVAGRTYRVKFVGHLNSTVATDDITARIYADSISGQELQIDRVDVAGSSTSGRKCIMEVEWVPTQTGPQTFVVTIVRSSGTGNGFVEAGLNRPAYFIVDYVGV
jgi:hypothetical protein